MNCHDLRKYVHPYLDSELDVQRNLEILEHLNACAACREIFETEEAAWERVRSMIGSERAPDTFKDNLSRILAAADRRESWRRTFVYVLPMGAAAALAIFIVMRQEGIVDRFAGDVPPAHAGHRVDDHGAGITFAVSHFNGLRRGADGQGVTLLSRDFLERHDEMEELDAEGARQVYRKLMGPNARIPSALRGKRIHGAEHRASMDGSPVRGLLLADQKDQKYGLYVLDARRAGIKDMHPLGSEGMHADIRLDRCRGCHVIAVTRNDRVYVFVTQADEAVGDAIALARETF